MRTFEKEIAKLGKSAPGLAEIIRRAKTAHEKLMPHPEVIKRSINKQPRRIAQVIYL